VLAPKIAISKAADAVFNQVITSRASALLSVEPHALPPMTVDPVGVPRPTPSEFPGSTARSGSEAGERGAKRAASDAPAHWPSAEVGAMAHMGAEIRSESGG